MPFIIFKLHYMLFSAFDGHGWSDKLNFLLFIDNVLEE